MAETMQFDLVSPERSLASVQATAVMIPGAEGDLTAMAQHAPTITTLRPGLLRVESAEGTKEYLVTGGFAEIGPEGTSVLAEQALPREEVTAEFLDQLVAEANQTKEQVVGDALDGAVKLLADLDTARRELGFI